MLSRPVDLPAAKKAKKKQPALPSGDELVRNQMRCLTAIDEGLGRILATLEEKRVLDNTLVVFTSDNGYFNMLAPILLMRALVDGMIARRFGRIVNITSGAVKAPIAELGLSNGARSGLTGFVAGLARSVAQHNVTVNNILPGAFDTERLRANFAFNAKKAGKSPEEMAQARMQATPARRLGTVAEFGDACAFLCSVQAGFITGQNLLLDGGAYPGTF